MKNDEKIDIQLDDEVSEDMDAIQKAEKNYETAHRYIEISQFMKKYEDRDKYLQRGIRYMKKCQPALNVRKELRALRLQLFQQRAQGRIELYEEASRILKTAKNEKDYNAALDLFTRIYKHEQTRSIPENLVDPELYKRVQQYSDSEEKIKYCEEQLDLLAKKDKNKTRIASGIALIILICLVFFSKTLTFHQYLGEVLTLTHSYGLAYGRFEYVYSNTSDKALQEKMLEKSSECHYLEAKKALAAKNTSLAFDDLSICVSRNYKDSASLLENLEIEKIASAEIGQYVRFGSNGEIEWKVLEKKDGMALLYKKYGLKKPPAFNKKDIDVTWETCTLRPWLNNHYYNEKFTDVEKTAIATVTVPADDNTTYGTSGGNDTQDKVYILSSTEYEKYKDLLPETESASWLRTPGKTQNSMSLVNRYKSILGYGYVVSSRHFTVKPVLWVKYE